MPLVVQGKDQIVAVVDGMLAFERGRDKDGNPFPVYKTAEGVAYQGRGAGTIFVPHSVDLKQVAHAIADTIVRLQPADHFNTNLIATSNGVTVTYHRASLCNTVVDPTNSCGRAIIVVNGNDHPKGSHFYKWHICKFTRYHLGRAGVDTLLSIFWDMDNVCIHKHMSTPLEITRADMRAVHEGVLCMLPMRFPIVPEVRDPSILVITRMPNTGQNGTNNVRSLTGRENLESELKTNTDDEIKNPVNCENCKSPLCEWGYYTSNPMQPMCIACFASSNLNGVTKWRIRVPVTRAERLKVHPLAEWIEDIQDGLTEAVVYGVKFYLGKRHAYIDNELTVLYSGSELWNHPSLVGRKIYPASVFVKAS